MASGDVARQAAAAPLKSQKPGNGAAEAIVSHGTEPLSGPSDAAFGSDEDESHPSKPVAAANVPGEKIPTLKLNMFGFTSVHFKAAALSTKSYPESNRTTKKIANILVELGTSRTYLKGSVKAVKYPERPKSVAEVGFFGAQNQGSCLATDDARAQAAMADVKSEIIGLFAAWRKATGVAVYVPANALELDDVI